MLPEVSHAVSNKLRARRILLVSNFYPPYVAGGAELVAANLAGWLAQLADVEVTVVTTCGPGTNEQPELINGVHVVRYFPPNLWWNFERFQSADSRSSISWFGTSGIPGTLRRPGNLRASWMTSNRTLFTLTISRASLRLSGTQPQSGESHSSTPFMTTI